MRRRSERKESLCVSAVLVESPASDVDPLLSSIFGVTETEGMDVSHQNQFPVIGFLSDVPPLGVHPVEHRGAAKTVTGGARIGLPPHLEILMPNAVVIDHRAREDTLYC